MWNPFSFSWFTRSAENKAFTDKVGLCHLRNSIGNGKGQGDFTAGAESTEGDGNNNIEANGENPTLQPRSKPRPDGDTRKDAMAYWRMNTRRERPTDSHHYQRLTHSGQAWSPYQTAAPTAGMRQRFDHTIPHDLSILNSALSNENKHSFQNAYMVKNQNQMESRRLDYGLDSVAAKRLEQYPHYQGGWQPSRLEDDGINTSAAHPSAQDDDALAPAAPAQEIAAPALDINSLVGQPAASQVSPGYLNEADVPTELIDSLKSIESSPQCDALFEQSAETYAHEHLQIQAPVIQKPAIAESIDEQSTTIDSMPSVQFSELQIAVADHPDTSADVLYELARNSNPDVRFAIAENHNADVELLRMLSEDDNPFVAARARKTLRRLTRGQCAQGDFSTRDKGLRKAN
jgi:hypothetical protein